MELKFKVNHNLIFDGIAGLHPMVQCAIAEAVIKTDYKAGHSTGFARFAHRCQGLLFNGGGFAICIDKGEI